MRRLHIGGHTRKDGWEVMDALPGPHVDHVGDARDLSRFGAGSFGEVYASHVVEHFSYKDVLPATLKEWCRALVPGGKLYVSVPDLDRLCRMFVHPELTPDSRFQIMRMMFGGQMNAFDFHYVGLNFEFLGHFLHEAGFVDITRVPSFGLFDDTSNMVVGGVAISLNVVAKKR